MVAAHLRAWGLADEIDAVTLAVSELVTNAVVHGRGLIEVTVKVRDGTIRLEVADHGGGRPTLVPTLDAAPTGGLGLHIVDRMANKWGSVLEGERTSVWVERPVHEGRERERDPGAE
jgi:anti-sigma regulatory factor (Ser/Thr protein kinase)